MLAVLFVKVGCEHPHALVLPPSFELGLPPMCTRCLCTMYVYVCVADLYTCSHTGHREGSKLLSLSKAVRQNSWHRHGREGRP